MLSKKSDKSEKIALDGVFPRCRQGVDLIKPNAEDMEERRREYCYPKAFFLQESKKELSDGVLAGGENLYTIDAQALKKLLR